jgi:hypothetical protein
MDRGGYLVGENLLMRHFLLALSALALLGTAVPAKASCPPGTAYSCVPSYGGKMACGCH